MINTRVGVKTGQGAWTRAIEGDLNNKLTTAGAKQHISNRINQTGAHAHTTDNKTACTRLNEKYGDSVSNLFKHPIAFTLHGQALTFSVVPVITCNPS